jgi:hypothetical protein
MCFQKLPYKFGSCIDEGECRIRNAPAKAQRKYQSQSPLGIIQLAFLETLTPRQYKLYGRPTDKAVVALGPTEKVIHKVRDDRNKNGFT